MTVTWYEGAVPPFNLWNYPVTKNYWKLLDYKDQDEELF